MNEKEQELQKKLLGTVVSMMVMAHDCETVGKAIGDEGKEIAHIYSANYGYQVTTVCADDEIGIHVIIIDDKVPYDVELTSSGVLTVNEGSAGGFIDAADSYLEAW